MAGPYYLNTVTGGGYVDPGGATWGAGSDANPGTSKALPKLTFAAACALVTANNDTLTIAPGTYVHSSAANQLTTANRTGIIMQGADANPANWPVIDGSGLTGDYAVLVRGQTTIQYMDFRYCNKTAAYANSTNAISSGYDAATILVTHCRFQENHKDLYSNGNGTLTATCCVFIEPAYASIYADVNFHDTGIMNVYYNKFYGRAYGKPLANHIRLNCTNGNTGPTVSVYNNLFAGGYNGLYWENFDGTINIKNNWFAGMARYAIDNADAGAPGPTMNITNNAYVSGGWPANANALTYLLHNCTDSSPITDQRLSTGYRQTGYIIFRKDDGYDINSAPASLNWSETWASKLAAKGWKLTMAVDYGGADLYNTWTQLKRIQDDYGAEIASHSRSHCAMNNDTNINFFTVAYTGAGTWSLVITPAGTAPADTNSLSLTESVTGLNVTINLVTGTITGDTWDQTLLINNLTTWRGIWNYLTSKTFLTVTQMPVNTPYSSGYAQYCLSRSMGAVNLSGAGVKNIIVDKTLLHYYEMYSPIAEFAAQGISISNTFCYPFYLWDAGAIADLLALGFRTGLGDDFKVATSGKDLRSFNMMNIGEDNLTFVKVLSDADTRIWINKVCEAVKNQLRVVSIMAHGDTELSESQMDIIIDEISKHSGIKVVSASEFYQIVTNDPAWSTADGGQTYTRSTWLVDDYFHGPMGSALFNGGVDVGLTTDFTGRTVPLGSAPDIGPYETAGGGSMGMSMGMGL